MNAPAIKGKVTAERIPEIERELLKLPQAAIITTHHFAPGLYAREIFIPAGTMLTGVIHKHDDIAVVSHGDISVLSASGWKRIKAPCTMVCKAGTKRLGYTHADTVYTTFHATTETDIEKLESELFHNNDGKETHELLRLRADREDFADSIKALGYSPEEVRAISETEWTQVDCPNIRIGASLIEGNGVFALRNFSAGEVIGPVRIDGKRTQAGRYLNHSATPNSIGIHTGVGLVELFAMRAIREGEELTLDYKRARADAEKEYEA